LAKGVGWDDLHPPDPPRSNHASVFVVLNGAKFLCEPTWGAGSFIDGVWRFSYNQHQFLKPLECRLNDHFPMDGSEGFLDRPLSYERFLRAVRHRPNEHEFRSESHVFTRFKCSNGYVRIQFSISKGENEVWGRAYSISGNVRKEIEHHLQHIELIEESEKRKRYVFHAVFESAGLFLLSMFIDGWEQSFWYVDNEKGTKELPFLSYTIGDSGFTAISPTAGLTKIESGFALIRFCVNIHRSRLLMDVVNCKNENFRKLARYVRLIIPGDRSRYEDVVTISFPTAGLWSVVVYLQNDRGSFTTFVTYYFEVSRGIEELVFPLECVPSDREPVPVVTSENLSIVPCASAVFVDSLTFCLTATFRGELLLNLKPADVDDTIFPTECSKTEVKGVTTIQYQFSVGTAGNYRLLMFQKDKDTVEQLYSIGLGRRKVEWVTPAPAVKSRPELQPKSEALPGSEGPESLGPKPAPEEDGVSGKTSKCCILL
jgi:hypothetical protein